MGVNPGRSEAWTKDKLTGHHLDTPETAHLYCYQTGLERKQLAQVIVQDGESLESALRRFKRKVQQEEIIKDAKKHAYYLKPGEKKRLKQALARKRARKKLRQRRG